jgi:hypothetical protein
MLIRLKEFDEKPAVLSDREKKVEEKWFEYVREDIANRLIPTLNLTILS